MIEAASQMYCQPEVYFEAREWDVDGKMVMEVWVPPSKVRPHKAKQEGQWLAYTRREDENILASPVHLELWKGRIKPKGELWEYTDREKKLLEALGEAPMSLNQIGKLVGGNRHKVINLIARLVSWEVVKMEVAEGRYRFRV
jgi:predicted HTH transcriptional regulator